MGVRHRPAAAGGPSSGVDPGPHPGSGLGPAVGSGGGRGEALRDQDPAGVDPRVSASICCELTGSYKFVAVRTCFILASGTLFAFFPSARFLQTLGVWGRQGTSTDRRWGALGLNPPPTTMVGGCHFQTCEKSGIVRKGN